MAGWRIAFIHRYKRGAGRESVLVSFTGVYRRAMSTKHVRTTGDLARMGCSARIECSGCGAARTVSGIQLASAGGNIPLATLIPRLKCARCGAKGAMLTVLPPV